jgi:hypothetical protein
MVSRLEPADGAVPPSVYETHFSPSYFQERSPEVKIWFDVGEFGKSIAILNYFITIPISLISGIKDSNFHVSP